LKFNVAPEKLPSQQEGRFPTIFRGELLNFGVCVVYGFGFLKEMAPAKAAFSRYISYLGWIGTWMMGSQDLNVSVVSNGPFGRGPIQPHP